jgi:hypothetical protein
MPPPRMSDRSPGRSLCVTTWYDEGFAPLGDLCLESLRVYSARHGHDLRLPDAPRADRPPAWHKIEVILHLLETGYEFVLWVDADAVVVRPEVGIHGELVDGKDLYLVKHSYDHREIPNTGVCLFRNTDWVRGFLKRAWESEHHLHHPWWENAAVIEILGYHEAFDEGRQNDLDQRLLERVQWLPVKWNSLPGLQEAEHAVITHYAGRPFAFRAEHMSADLERVRASQDRPGPFRRLVRGIGGLRARRGRDDNCENV